jgi:hypothetical protein
MWADDLEDPDNLAKWHLLSKPFQQLGEYTRFKNVVTYRSHTLPAVRALDPKPEERQNGPRSNAEVTKICPIACTNGYWKWDV